MGSPSIPLKKGEFEPIPFFYHINDLGNQIFGLFCSIIVYFPLFKGIWGDPQPIMLDSITCVYKVAPFGRRVRDEGKRFVSQPGPVGIVSGPIAVIRLPTVDPLPTTVAQEQADDNPHESCIHCDRRYLQ